MKKMVLQANKPVLFSILHERISVNVGIDLFKESLKGKKTLFIELEPIDVTQALGGKMHSLQSVAAYQKLVVEAGKAGLKVVALDNRKDIEEYSRMAKDIENTSHSDKKFKQKLERMCYLEYNKRETKWLKKLKPHGAEAIVVMHPGHASEIAKRLRIPKQNIIGSLLKKPGRRKLAEKEAARIRVRETAVRRKNAKKKGKPTGFARKALVRRRTGK